MDYESREEELELINSKLEYLEKTLKDYKNPKKDKFGFYKDTPVFREVAFKTLIENGLIDKDGKITYMLSVGIEWTVQISLEDFRNKVKVIKEKEKIKSKENRLKEDDVLALLEYCRGSKDIHQMNKFFNKYKNASSLKFFIVKPLIGKGLMKMTMPEKPSSSYQRYYTVEGKEN